MTITRGHGKDVDYMIEQSYRRGFCHGFHVGINTPKEKHVSGLTKIIKWRSKLTDKAVFEYPPGSGMGKPI